MREGEQSPCDRRREVGVIPGVPLRKGAHPRCSVRSGGLVFRFVMQALEGRDVHRSGVRSKMGRSGSFLLDQPGVACALEHALPTVW